MVQQENDFMINHNTLTHCQHIIKTASMTVLPRLKSLELTGPNSKFKLKNSAEALNEIKIK